MLLPTNQVGKYELHLTFVGEKPKILSGWWYSKIADDPYLGPGIRHYLTTYASTKTSAYAKLTQAMLDRPDFIRAKIEHIVYDSRKND